MSANGAIRSPPTAFSADFWNVFDESKATSSEGRYWFSQAEVRTHGNNTPMLSGFCGPPAPFPTWQQKAKRVLKALLSVVFIMSRCGPFFCCEGSEVLLFCSCLDWELFYGCIFFSLTNQEPGMQKLTFHYLPRPLELLNDKIRSRSFSCFSTIRFGCHCWINDDQKEGGIFI